MIEQLAGTMSWKLENERAHERITWIFDDYMVSIPALDCLPKLFM